MAQSAKGEVDEQLQALKLDLKAAALTASAAFSFALAAVHRLHLLQTEPPSSRRIVESKRPAQSAQVHIVPSNTEQPTQAYRFRHKRKALTSDRDAAVTAREAAVWCLAWAQLQYRVLNMSQLDMTERTHDDAVKCRTVGHHQPAL